MNTTVTLIVVLVIIVIAAVVAAGVVAMRRRRRSSELREQFGPEYDRAVAEGSSRHQAERELAARQEQRSELEIRDLDPARREFYAGQWRSVQARFVDEPVQAVAEADGLLTALMSERGYPVDDFNRRTATVSVDHPDVVQKYRAAHDISTASTEGRASTEDCRNALVHYRSVFVLLLGQGPAGDQAADLRRNT
jgi:hypothetical protein